LGAAGAKDLLLGAAGAKDLLLKPDRARDHGALRMRKDPRHELGGRLPVQALRDGGMVNANRQESSERP
jgi:hypothetical protein